MYPPRPCQLCRFSGVVWGRFGATCGPQKPSRERAAAEPGIRKENGERVGTPCGREDDGRTEEDESGENWGELDERKGKEGEGSWRKRRRKLRKSETEPATGKTKTEAEYYPEEIRVEGGGERTWKRCEERSGETDGNRTQGRGRNGKEAEGNTSGRGRRDPWRKLYRTVERTGRKEGEGSGEREGGGNAPGERR